jgi:2-dehydro-3-deoxyphosphogluconate aldolase / (4S)-4-hydroxy-2-oxoglutarate aldolase
MNKNQILDKILESGIIAILRVVDPSKVGPIAEAISAGGIHAIEVAMNTPDALNCIRVIKNIPGVIAGAGTITNPDMARQAIMAGAEFLVSPISTKEIIDACHQLKKPIFSGAFTPGEIFQAHAWGADVVKVFPAELLGMKYIRAIRGPFHDIKLMPTGGVTPENIDKWFETGAVCVGVGGSFTKSDLIENEEWGRLTDIAREFTSNIEHYRNRKADY